MKYGDVSLGQVEAAINKLGGMEGFNALLAGDLTVIHKPPEPRKILKVNIDALAEPFEERTFFKSREGLWVADSMRRVFDAAPTTAAIAGPSTLRSFELLKNAYDREIRAELSEDHQVELWHIAELIKLQPGGKPGALLNNGYANIFYVRGFAVVVGWHSGFREWRVVDWSLGDASWRAGRRVFSRN